MNAQSDEDRKGALSAASYGEHENKARTSLDQGAGVNPWGGVCGNALHDAPLMEHKKIVKVLIT